MPVDLPPWDAWLAGRPEDRPEFDRLSFRLASWFRPAWWWRRSTRLRRQREWEDATRHALGQAYALGRRFSIPDTVPVKFIVVATEDEHGQAILAAPTVEDATLTRQVAGWLHGKDAPLIGQGGSILVRGPMIPVDQIAVAATCRDFTVLRGDTAKVMAELWRTISPDG